MLATPLVINVLRGDDIESRHEVDVVVVDRHGSVVEAWGEGERLVMPRSSAKPIQASALIATGAAAAFEVDQIELALACASHNGEEAQVERVLAWLNRIGLGPEDLECGQQYPGYQPAMVELVASGRPVGPEHNNCSGKHAGFLSVCRHEDLPTAGYIDPGHPLQRDHVTPVMEEICRFDSGDQTPSIDGCGIPVWQMPLVNLARGWAGLTEAGPGRQLLEAMMAAPYFVAGTERASTRFMTDPLRPVAAKVGAEGVYCAALPDDGVAVAMKARDGAARAAEVAMEHVLVGLGAVEATAHLLHNWAGTVVGSVAVEISGATP